MNVFRTCSASSIEVLESRIAPASVTFTDVDGALVTVKTSLGSAAELEASLILAPEGSGMRLQKLDLANKAVFAGAKVVIVKGTFTDGALVDVGYIDATGIDLGKVKVDGDLGQIDAGDLNSVTPGLKKLIVGSMGVNGTATQGTVDGAGLDSRILGRLGELLVKGDFRDAKLTVLGVDPDPDPDESTGIDARGDIGDITIRGSLLGGAVASSGSIYAKGDIASIRVLGSVLGGTGDDSGSITSERRMGAVLIDGNVEGGILMGGGTSDRSGRIFSGDTMGLIRIGGYLKGGDGIESGNISSATGLANVKIFGSIDDNGDQVSVLGGAGEKSAAIGTGGAIGKIIIAHSIKGGAGRTSGSILSVGPMLSVTISGDLIGGSSEESGAIGSVSTVGDVIVKGDLRGGSASSSGIIVSSDTIASVRIDGSVFGGSNFESGAIGSLNPLGPVRIGGDLQGGEGTRSGVVVSAEGVTRVKVLGSIVGGAGDFSGSVLSDQKIDKVRVEGSIEGGEGFFSGAVQSAGAIAKVVVDGSVIGGDGSRSGGIHSSFSRGKVNGVLSFGSIGSEASADIARGVDVAPVQDIGVVVIGGTLQGGFGFDSGQVNSGGQLDTLNVGAITGGDGSFGSGSVLSRSSIGTVLVRGSVTGGEAGNSGVVHTDADLGRITIKGDLQGGSGFIFVSSEAENLGAQIFAAGRLGAVRVDGKVAGGGGEGSAGIQGRSIESVIVAGDVAVNGFRSASIIAYDGNLGELRIGGNAITGPEDPLRFAAAGELGIFTVGSIVGRSDAQVEVLAGERIGSITVRDSSTYADILAGYSVDGTPVNRDARIGNVVIGTTGAGNWIGTNLVAGAVPGDDGVFGTADDEAIFNGGTSAPSSRIDTVVIKGTISPTFQSFDQYGIVAALVTSARVGGNVVPLTSGPLNDFIDLTPGGPPAVAEGNVFTFGGLVLNERLRVFGPS